MFIAVTKHKNTHIKNLFQLPNHRNSSTDYENSTSHSSQTGNWYCLISAIHHDYTTRKYARLPCWGEQCRQLRWALTPWAFWCETPKMSGSVVFYMLAVAIFNVLYISTSITCSWFPSLCARKNKVMLLLPVLSSLCSHHFLSGQQFMIILSNWRNIQKTDFHECGTKAP